MIQLPENFESYGEARKNGFLKMKELKETFVMQLPSSRDEAAVDAWEQEIIRFWKKST